jgi:NRAMP (natural resistance-associated macrophage protein)-like metal ion transporter
VEEADDSRDSKKEQEDQADSNKFSIKSALRSLGPGLITGASDDDPSGIATYSQAGASFGLGMLWMALFQLPMMTVVQEMCARIGLVEGDGLTFVIKKKYSMKVVLPLASLLLIANTINIGADIGAMGASLKLLIPQIPFFMPTLLFTGFILLAEIAIPYHKYVKILKYLTISLFAYVITAMIVGGSFGTLLIASVVPHIEFTSQFAIMFVAILGTTISPYLFFWQTSQEAEEDLDKKKIEDIDIGKPQITKKELRIMRTDVAVGMFFSQLIMWSIIVTTAGSLHTHGISDIQTSDQAAKALEPAVKSFPNSGQISKLIFALGINRNWTFSHTCFSRIKCVCSIGYFWVEAGTE